MATSYPTSLDALTNPTSSDSMSSPSHSGQHADANDAIEALQTKVGVDSSAVTTSLDYRVTQLESGGGSMTTSATAPSSPSDGDMWYDTSTGRTYVYYDDGSSQQWVEFGAAPDAGIMHVSSGAPSSPNAGDMWYDTDDGTTSLYYDDGSSQQWVQFGAAPVTTGKILQVVSTTKTDTFSTTSSTLTDITGLSVNITPTATSSNIVVMSQVTIGSPSATNFGLQIVRDSTAILISDSGQNETLTFTRAMDTATLPFTFVYVDSPATTSATTYKMQIRAGSGTVNVNIGSNTFYAGTSTITVMEVAG
jgi:hypothetical protein